MRYLLILLCLNCATESDVATWGTEIERDTTTVQTGANSILFNDGLTGAIRGDFIPVVPGKPYRAFAGIRDDDSGDAGDKLHLYVEWFTSAKISISTDDVWPDSWPNTGDAWVGVETIADSPATAAFCQLIADKTADSANGQEMWVDHFKIVAFPLAFQAFQGTGIQNIANKVLTKVQYPDENFDNGSNFDNTVNYRFTAPVGGVYIADCAVKIDDAGGFAGGNLVTVYLYKNGVAHRIVDKRRTTAGGRNLPLLNAIPILLVAGDFLEVWIIHQDGAGVFATLSADTSFAVYKVE